MGLLRTLLALGVVIGHMGTSAPLQMVGGFDAVRVFFMISGYLMSLILVESKAYATTKRFYLSRMLRIYPVYLVMAAVALILYLGIGYQDFLGVYAKSGPVPRLSLVFSNLVIFGQAQIMFLAKIGGHLVYPAAFTRSSVLYWQGLLLPPAWTLELELLFYLVAPFLLPRRRWMWTLLAVSFFTRVALVLAGIGFRDPWAYRFFPTELAFFIAGALAHQVLAPRYASWFDDAKKDRLAAVGLGTLILYLFVMPHFMDIGPWTRLFLKGVLYGGSVLLLPLIIHFQNRHRLDRKIGELSYPIYISHWVPIMVLAPTWLPKDFFSSAGGEFAGVVVAILLAWVLNRIVAEPIERFRHRFRAKPVVR